MKKGTDDEKNSLYTCMVVPEVIDFPKNSIHRQSGARAISFTGEHLSLKGARVLAERLQDFWHAKGYPAARFWPELIDERLFKVGSTEMYRVASNLVGGLPPRYLAEDMSTAQAATEAAVETRC